MTACEFASLRFRLAGACCACVCVRIYVYVCAPAHPCPSSHLRARLLFATENEIPILDRCYFHAVFLDRESRTGSLRVYFSLSISFVNVINVIVRHRYFPPRSDGIFIGTRKGNEARIVSRFSFSPHDHLRQKGEKIAEHEDTNNIYEATGCYVERVLIKLVSRARNNRT